MSELITAVPTETTADRDSFQRYYEEAGPDYAAWSRSFNMHFGFFRWGMNPFNREAMLEQMNREILNRLQLAMDPLSDSARLASDCSTSAPSARVLDMGCGLGATLRSFARRLPYAHLHGITLVPWQLDRGNHLNRSCAQGERITLALGDYEQQPSLRAPSMPSAHSKAVATLMAPLNPLFFTKRIVCCAPADASLSSTAFLAPASCVVRNSASTASSVTAG